MLAPALQISAVLDGRISDLPDPSNSPLSYTREDVRDYLKNNGLPGIDTHLDKFENTDGPCFKREGDTYVAYWSERGFHDRQFSSVDEGQFRLLWADFICKAVLYPMSPQCS